MADITLLRGDGKFHYFENELGTKYINSVRDSLDLQAAFGDALKTNQNDVDKSISSDEYHYRGKIYNFKDLGNDYVQHIRDKIELRDAFTDALEKENYDVDKALKNFSFYNKKTHDFSKLSPEYINAVRQNVNTYVNTAQMNVPKPAISF